MGILIRAQATIAHNKFIPLCPDEAKTQQQPMSDYFFRLYVMGKIAETFLYPGTESIDF